MATAVTLRNVGTTREVTRAWTTADSAPAPSAVWEDGPESIDSIIDMDAVCKRVTTLGLMSVTISQDAGR